MINVLDHGFVDLRDHMGDDLSICRAARVSHGGENYVQERTEGENRKLIRYLMCHKHTSPFEQVVFTFHVKAPIFVFRQWHRHRTWSFNEISGRYSVLKDEYYLPLPTRMQEQSKSNKQGSGKTLDLQVSLDIFNSMDADHKLAAATYHDYLDRGLTNELARINLPLVTYSEMYATVDLHNLFHFLKLRMDSHSQYEIQVYAKAIYELIKPIVPEACKAFSDYILNAQTFSAQEMYLVQSFFNKEDWELSEKMGAEEYDTRLPKRELEEFKKKLGLE